LDLDVLSFGVVLYEMSFGHSFILSDIDQLPESTNQDLASILRSIFIDNGSTPPTILDLCNHSFFNTIPGFKRPEVVPLDKTLQLMLGSKVISSSSTNSELPRSNSNNSLRKKVVVNEPITTGWQPGPNSVITTTPRMLSPRIMTPSTSTTSISTTTTTTSNSTYITSNTQPQQKLQQPTQSTIQKQTIQQPQKTQPVVEERDTSKQHEDAHLNAIESFGGLARLKKTVTNDRSAPILKSL